ncbi:MAG: HAMP domain-containing sensor histidine kinase, partial [Bacteroidota bacterium]
VKEEWEFAEDLYSEWFKEIEDFPNPTSKANQYFTYATLLQRSKQDEALEVANKGLEFALEIGSIEKQQLYYQLLAEIYEDRGALSEAIDFLEQSYQLKDSLRRVENSGEINELTIKFESEKKEKEIKLLAKRNELAESRQNLLLVISVLILSVAVLLFVQYRQRNKYAQQVEEKNLLLSETMASKERLFSVIAHDLKSPLSAFSAMSSTLAENIDAFKKEQIVTYLRKFEKSSQNLSDLLNNLLQWSLSQTGTLSINIEELDVRKSIENAVKPLVDLAESKDIKLVIEGESVVAKADSKMVETILRNLVSNALKFTASNGEVRISAEKQENAVTVKVADNGIGIADKDLEKLFDVQQDPAKIGDHEEKGTGLGLILSKELVEKNMGSITVESQKNKGTTFFITLPLAA